MSESTKARVAEVFCKRSVHAFDDDPQLDLSEICEATNLPGDEALMALRQLAGDRLIYIRRPNPPSGGPEDDQRTVFHARSRLFISFDRLFMGWNPAEDAKEIAAAIPTGMGQSLAVHQFIGERAWTIRRVNPGIALLLQAGRFESVKVYVADGLVDKSIYYRGRF